MFFKTAHNIRKKLANFGRTLFVVPVNLYVMTVPTVGGFLRSLLLKPVPIRNMRPLSSATRNEPIIPLNLPFLGKISTTVASASRHGLSFS